jgi:hypothetical protein
MWMDHITMEQRRAGTALVGRSTTNNLTNSMQVP